MPALAPAVVLALAAQWAMPVAPRQILAQATVESALDPLAIHDDVTGRVYHPASLAQALRIATHCEMDGHDIDVGLLQINSGNFPWLHLSLAEAFNPVQSIRAGAHVLTALSKYNTGSPTRGLTNGYVRHVAAAERAAPPTRNGPASHGSLHQPLPQPSSDLHDDLINALIQPQSRTTLGTPLRRPVPASARHADRQTMPNSGTNNSNLTDPLIHPQPASTALTREASNG